MAEGRIYVLAYWKGPKFLQLRTSRQTITRDVFDLKPDDEHARKLAVICRNLTNAGYTLAWADLGPVGSGRKVSDWMDEVAYIFNGADFGPGLIEA